MSQRKYAFVRRRIIRPNEISDSDSELSRKIRSTTPDSREVDNVKANRQTERRFNSRFRVTNINDDSVPAAASQVSRGQLRPQISPDEIFSLTPVDIEPQFVPRQGFNPRNGRQFRGRATPASSVSDSELSAAEVRTSNILPRGRNRFNPSSTTEASVQTNNLPSTAAQRRPTFARFSPRPFGRNSISTTEVSNSEQLITQRTTPRFQFTRIRPNVFPVPQARNVPFQRPAINIQKQIENDNDELESKVGEDINLSESERQEKEHEDNLESTTKASNIWDDLDLSDNNYNDDDETETKTIETTTLSDLGKRRFKIIRRRPISTTALPVISSSSIAPSSSPIRIRKIIRKKLKPVDEQELIAQSVATFDAAKETSTTTTTTEIVLNYGDKTRATSATSTENIPTTTTEQVTLKLSNNLPQSDENIIIMSTNKSVTEAQEENPEFSTVKSVTPVEVSLQKESKVIEEPDIDDEKKISTEMITLQPVEDNNQENTEFYDENKENTEYEKETDENQDVLTTVSLNTETEETQTEKPTTSTTQLPSSIRTRAPYRPQKRLFTSTTQSSLPSSSRVFSRKYNPGAYTSPATANREPFRSSTTRRPISSRLFTRKPSTTASTTQKEVEEEEEEILEEEPEENPLVLVPLNQLFTRKPDFVENKDTDDEPEEILEEEEDVSEEEPENELLPTTKKPAFKPKVINSNTFRTSTSTTEIPKRVYNNNNRTGIYTRFSSNKPINDTKKRVQNVPVGYNTPIVEPKPSLKLNISQENQTQLETGKDILKSSTAASAATQNDFQSTSNFDDDDYVSTTEATTITTVSEYSLGDNSTNTVENETTTNIIEVDSINNDYLEQTEDTTNSPTTDSSSTYAQNIATFETTIPQTTQVTTTVSSIETFSESPETTTLAPITPIVKTQYNKLFSVSRVVEVSSKQDKHRLNKNNETTLIEEGQIKIEKKPMVDQIGEVSRFSLIKIFEDEIPIYLTKLGHVYPVDNPPDNPIRIDEARNARALVSFLETPKENLVASESINEAYRHVKRDYDKNTLKDHIEHLPIDHFLSYINDEKVTEKPQEETMFSKWQFIPAAYENEQNKAKLIEIVTPRSMLTNPSTLPLEGLFKTENPIMARKVLVDNQPFVVYSASVPMQEDKANIVQLNVLKPETGRSIVTFAKGQEFNGAFIEESTVKNPISVSILPSTISTSTLTMSTSMTTPTTTASTTTTATSTSTTTTSTTTTTTTTTEKPLSSPLLELLSSTTTTQKPPSSTAASTATTEAIKKEIITPKVPIIDTKRNRFPFARRPILKPSNFTRPSTVPRVSKKVNATASPNSFQKSNKTASFAPKSRISGRVQNIPIDFRKKGGAIKTTKSYTTEAPRTTTERKILIKQFRPGFQRPAFIPRKLTTPATVSDT